MFEDYRFPTPTWKWAMIVGIIRSGRESFIQRISKFSTRSMISNLRKISINSNWRKIKGIKIQHRCKKKPSVENEKIGHGEKIRTQRRIYQIERKKKNEKKKKIETIKKRRRNEKKISVDLYIYHIDS